MFCSGNISPDSTSLSFLVSSVVNIMSNCIIPTGGNIEALSCAKIYFQNPQIRCPIDLNVLLNALDVFQRHLEAKEGNSAPKLDRIFEIAISEQKKHGKIKIYLENISQQLNNIFGGDYRSYSYARLSMLDKSNIGVIAELLQVVNDRDKALTSSWLTEFQKLEKEFETNRLCSE